MQRNRRPSSGEIARGRMLRLWREAQLLAPRIDPTEDDDITPPLSALEVATARMEARL